MSFKKNISNGQVLDRLLSLERLKKRVLQIIFDSALIVGCYILAMALRLDGFGFLNTPHVWNVLIFVVPFTLVLFVRLGFYRAVLRYISSRFLRTIIYGVLISAASMFLIDQLFVLPVPRSVPIIYSMLLFCAVGSTRYGWRALYRLRTSRQKESVVIYGAGMTGRQLLDAIRYVGDSAVVGFVDDDEKLHNQEISSIKVYSPENLGVLKQKMGITAVLLAIPSASKTQRRRIIEKVEQHTLQLRTIPAIADIVSGKAEVSDLKIVQPDELLGREIVPPNEQLLRANITGKVVMVTGAGGSIGSELCRQIAKQSPKCLILYDTSEFSIYKINDDLEKLSASAQISTIPLIGSVQNKKRLARVLEKFDVQTIYHAAAYKHVPLVEKNVVEGIRNNVFGTKALLEAAVNAKVESLTFISTDKAVRPTSFMGASKRVAELICQSFAEANTTTKISMVRFGNVLGSSGSVIPRFKDQIKSGGPITVTHPKITRFFMTISEAAQLVIQAGAMAKGGDVFVLDMGEPVEIADLARRMIKLHGLEPYFEDSTQEEIENGDICIKFSGLRPGEKLYEELLIGNNPSGTQHPRIMCSDELRVDQASLENVLNDLHKACEEFDAGKIREILLSMPIEFTPHPSLTDSFWLRTSDNSDLPEGHSNVIDLRSGE